MAFGSKTAVGISFEGDDKVSPVVRGIRNTMDGFKRDAATGFGLGAGISVFNTAQRALGSVVDTMGDAVRAAIEDEASVAKLTTAISENDAAWDGNIAKVEEVITARMDLAFADDVQRDSLARLVSVTGDTTKALELQRTAMDLARLRGMDLATAGDLIGKVYAGNLGTLSRYGIVLEKGTTATEALAEIQRRAAGQAEAYADTTQGSLEAINLRIGELQEGFGRMLMPAVDLATGALEAFLDEIDLLAGGGGTAAGSSALGRLRIELGLVVDEIEAVGTAAAAAAGDWVGTGTVVDSLVDTIFGLQTGLEDLGLAPHIAQVHEWEDALRPMAVEMELTEGQLYGLVEAGIAQGKTLDEMRAGFDTVGESADALVPALVAATGGTRKMALTEEEAAEAAKVLAGQLAMVAGTSLPELRQSARETFAAFVKAVEMTGNPLRALQREEDALMVLRRQAAKEGQWWNEAAIDQRLAEIKVEKQAQRAVKGTYDEAVTLWRQTGKDYSIDVPVDTSGISTAIAQVNALRAITSGLVLGEAGGFGSSDQPRPEHKGLQQAERKRQQEAYRDMMQRLREDTAAAAAETDRAAGSAGKKADATDKATKADERKAEAAKEAEKAEAALAREYDRVREAAAKASEAFQGIAKTDFLDMKTSGQEALDAIRASLDAMIDPLQVIRDEEAALKALRAEAMMQGRFDLMASIDLRTQELGVMQQQYLQMKQRYTEEHSALDILHEKLDISKRKAAELLETYRRKSDIGGDVTDEELARILVRNPATGSGGGGGGGGVYLDGYLVGKVLDERLGRQYGTASRVGDYRRSN